MQNIKISSIILTLMILLMSCGDNGKKIETNVAELVNIIKNNKTETYNIINDDSTLEWRATHLGGVQERLGEIFYKEATVLVNNGKVTNADFIIDMNSLIVENMSKDDNEELASHLKDTDFFNIENHPVSTFELIKTTSNQGRLNSKVTGNLTIMGVSKSITFNANIVIKKTSVMIWSEKFAINREDWGLTYHAEGSEGVPLDYLISNEIGFVIKALISK